MTDFQNPPDPNLHGFGVKFQAVDIDELNALRADKRRLDWLGSKVDQGVNTLGHKGPEQRGHVYTNQKWEPIPGTKGARKATWDHFWGADVRAALDKAMVGTPDETNQATYLSAEARLRVDGLARKVVLALFAVGVAIAVWLWL